MGFPPLQELSLNTPVIAEIKLLSFYTSDVILSLVLILGCLSEVPWPASPAQLKTQGIRAHWKQM